MAYFFPARKRCGAIALQDHDSTWRIASSNFCPAVPQTTTRYFFRLHASNSGEKMRKRREGYGRPKSKIVQARVQVVFGAVAKINRKQLLGNSANHMEPFPFAS